MTWWKSNKNRDNFIVEIEGYGEYEISLEEVEEFYSHKNLQCESPKENREIGLKISRLIAFELLITELKEKKIEIEKNIDAITTLFDRSIKELNPNSKKPNSSFDFDNYKQAKFEKLKGEELDDFLNSFFKDSDFVERMKEEDEANKKFGGNTRNSFDEQERMKENANFWKSNEKYSSSWWKTLGFEKLSDVTKKDVKIKFKELAKKYHPDVGGMKKNLRKY